MERDAPSRDRARQDDAPSARSARDRARRDLDPRNAARAAETAAPADTEGINEPTRGYCVYVYEYSENARLFFTGELETFFTIEQGKGKQDELLVIIVLSSIF